MPQKDAGYHRDAVHYNNSLAKYAAELAEEIAHPEVKKWSKAVSKQHNFHAGRHRQALAKIESAESPEAVVETEDGGEDVVVEENVNPLEVVKADGPPAPAVFASPSDSAPDASPVQS